MELTKEDIKKYKRLVFTIVKRFNNCYNRFSINDLMAFGYEGLMTALNNPRLDKTNVRRMNGYICTSIYRTIYREINKDNYFKDKEIVSLDNKIFDGDDTETYEDAILEKEKEDSSKEIELIKEIITSYEQREREIIELLLSGNTYKDTWRKVGYDKGYNNFRLKVLFPLIDKLRVDVKERIKNEGLF